MMKALFQNACFLIISFCMQYGCDTERGLRRCGNGIIDVGDWVEVCDDGNNAGGDGCSADCLSDETCGNGLVDIFEECDDGNSIDGDGCSVSCRVEPGWHCNGEPSICSATCGDGIRAYPVEDCDCGTDMNNLPVNCYTINGGEYSNETPGILCDASCNFAPICASGQKQCLGNTLQVCSNNQWMNDTICMQPTPWCNPERLRCEPY